MIDLNSSSDLRGTEPQSSPVPELTQLASNGILIGLPRAAALELNRSFPLIELRLRSESLDGNAVSRFLEREPQAHVIWRITIDKLHPNEMFTSNEAQYFVQQLRGAQSTRNTLVLGLNWEVVYSDALLASMDELQNKSGLIVFIDAEHYSWKSPNVQQQMQSLKLHPVFLDAPRLPGLVKDFTYSIGQLAVYRCLGRNRKGWFKHSVKDRFAYSYLDDEVCEIADRVQRLQADHNRILVTFSNYPTHSALATVIQLAEELRRRGIGQ